MSDAYTELRSAIDAGRTAKDLDLREAELAGADLERLNGDFLNLSGADLTGARLREAQLMDCDFPSARLREADFTRATLWQCKFRDADASQARFEGAHAENNFWSKVDFTGADFRSARLSETFFDESILRRARFDSAEGSGVRFKGCDLGGASLVEASFAGADFGDADLTGADLSRGNFRNADFTGAKLEGVRWEGAALDGARFDEGVQAVTQGAQDEVATQGAQDEIVTPAEVIAKMLGTTVEEMRARPEAVKENLVAVFRELTQTATHGEAAPAPETTRRLVERIRRELQARGVEVGKELDDLPNQLRELSTRLQSATPEDAAHVLRELANFVESPDGEHAGLDGIAAWLEANAGPLVGHVRERQERDERLQAEYREAAKRSIAASLRKVGIEPLTTEPERGRTRAKMNRQRLFWKEFAEAAADIKASLTKGEDAAARKRIAAMLDAFDLNLAFELALEGEDAVLTFPPPDDLETATSLQFVVRDSPSIEGWRIARGRRYEAN